MAGENHKAVGFASRGEEETVADVLKRAFRARGWVVYRELIREMEAVAADAGRGPGISREALKISLSRWFGGHRRPDGYNRSWLCAALGIPVEVLRMPRDGTEYPFRPRTPRTDVEQP